MEFILRYHREPITEKEREDLYGWIRIVAYWLDSLTNIGGLHVGLEAILGFIPIFGMLALDKQKNAIYSFIKFFNSFIAGKR